MNYEEIYEAMLAELVEKALHNMMSDPAVRMADENVTAASEALSEAEGYGAQTKLAVDRFLTAINLLLAAQYRHLYIQGAKDMVQTLREFDVIK